jgi:hypothetical protein
MGHAISRGGFFNIEVEPMRSSPRPGEVFAAIIQFKESPLTEAQLADELKHVFDDLWNWQVRKLTASEFAVVFPFKETLRLCARSGNLFLPLSKSEASIREAFLAPRPSLLLPSVWVQLTGVPEILLERERLMAAFVMIGRPMDVDELSMQKWDREPVRMRFNYRYPERIKGSIQICVNGEGFTVGVQAELGAKGGAGGSGGRRGRLLLMILVTLTQMRDLPKGRPGTSMAAKAREGKRTRIRVRWLAHSPRDPSNNPSAS